MAMARQEEIAMKTQIGLYVLQAPATYRNGYECAAWHQDVVVPAGSYPIEADVVAGKVVDTSIHVRLDGTVSSDNFQALWCGCPIGDLYDQKKNVGKLATHRLTPYAHEIACGILEDRAAPQWQLEGFEAREIPYTYHGEQRKTYGIFEVAS